MTYTEIQLGTVYNVTIESTIIAKLHATYLYSQFSENLTFFLLLRLNA